MALYLQIEYDYYYQIHFRGNEQQRKGFSLAIGSLEPELVTGSEEEVIHCLIMCSR